MFRTIIVAAILAAAVPAVAQKPSKPDDVEKSADARDKVICKKFTETGSLVRGYRICKTKAEWDRDRESLRSLDAANSCRAMANGGNC